MRRRRFDKEGHRRGGRGLLDVDGGADFVFVARPPLEGDAHMFHAREAKHRETREQASPATMHTLRRGDGIAVWHTFNRKPPSCGRHAAPASMAKDLGQTATGICGGDLTIKMMTTDDDGDDDDDDVHAR